jgi:predicted ATPase/DNA-binding SARP family transcriptional activator
MAVLTSGRLPVRLTPLVGRERELAAMTSALARSRLLTLTGPGGTGKTRLALAAAAELAAAADVAWVELAPVETPRLIAVTVAARLGVPETPGTEPNAAITAYLTARRDAAPVLVVLDNCEHLAADIAALTEYLLGECPELSVLATSREALGVEGERAWPVPPLDRMHAVELFADRARLVAPSFAITDANRDAVAEVCRKLDWLPLAIELAAARMRILSVRQLTERLDDVFGVLTGGARSAPARHQALRATLDWSHDLLAPAEAAIFRRLATFSGGCSLAAAERVGGFGDIAQGEVLDLLTRLADKSLLRAEHERYHMLATIREYAAAKLAAAGELDQARRAHLGYYTEFAEQTGERVEQAAAAELEADLDGLDLERANLRAAAEYARESGDATSGLRIAGQLGRYAYLRGRYQEVRELMDQAVAVGPAAPPQLRAKALYGSGRLAHLQCDYAPAVRRLDAALLIYRAVGDSAGIAACLQALGSVAREQGRYVRSAQLHAEGLELAKATGDERAEASARSYLGFVSWLQGDFDTAVVECSRALALFRGLRDVEGTAWSLISLGVVARCRAELDRATALLTESRELSSSIGFREGVAWCEEQLGLVALAEGDHAAAAARLRSSYATHRYLRDRWRMSSVLEDLAAVAVAAREDDGDGGDGGDDRAAELAARLLGAAQAMRDAIGTTLSPCERPQHDRTAAAARRSLGDTGYEAAWRQGTETPELDEPPGETSANPTAPAEGGTPLAAPHPATAARISAPSPVSPAPPAGASPDAEPVPEPRILSPLTGATPVFAPAPEPAAAPAPVRQPTAPSPSPIPAAQAPAPAGARAPKLRVPRQPTAAERAPRAVLPLRVRALGTATVELGGVALSPADWGYAKPRELLFLLATSPPLTREQLGTALWPELSRQQLGNALHTALRELRRALGDNDWAVYSGGKYCLNRDRDCDCDVDTFESALAAAGRVRPPSAALPDLQRAVAVYGGEFMAGVTAGEWALARRDELSRRFESALLAVGRLHVAAGRHQAAATAFRRAVEHEPLNESAHRELMTCWAMLGENARAVRHYTNLVRLLEEQVGVAPAPETTALAERLAERA